VARLYENGETLMGKEEDKDEYIKLLESQVIRLTESLCYCKNKKTGDMQSYIGLIIRDPSASHIDVIHNCKNKSVLVNILKSAIESIDKYNKIKKVN
jgi:hypothetical protein